MPSFSFPLEDVKKWTDHLRNDADAGGYETVWKKEKEEGGPKNLHRPGSTVASASQDRNDYLHSPS